MFPQEYRVTVIGVCNIIARAMTIMAPWITEMKEPNPIMILMAIQFIALANSFFLQATEEEGEPHETSQRDSIRLMLSESS